MKTQDKKGIILLDCGGVLFIENQNPQEVYKNIMNLFGGKDIEKMAIYFNLQDELEKIKRTESYQSKPPKVAPYFAGELLIDKLLQNGEIDKNTLINARIDAVRRRDDKIISTIKENFPNINIAIATQDGQSIHPVLTHYFPEIEDKFQIVTTDKDINAFKTSPDFYNSASNRLYIPTKKMALVDDTKANIQAIEDAGGMGTLFNPKDTTQSLENTVIETIESKLLKKYKK